MTNPRVTVIIPAYNHERFIEQSVRSVLAQDYDNIELVIINDGSSDGTDRVVQSLVDECRRRCVRFDYINKNNEGVARTLNLGVAWSQADYITAIASDDLMKPAKVSSLLAALLAAGPAVGLAYGDAEFINDAGQRIDLDNHSNSTKPGAGWSSFISFYTRNRPDVKIGENSFDYRVLLRGNYLPAMSVLWRRSALEQAGLFTPGLMIEDWDLWLRMARTCQGVYVPNIVASYRWHDTNTVKTMAARLREGQDFILRRELALFCQHQGLSRLIARLLLVNALKLILSGRYRLAFSRLFDGGLWRCAVLGAPTQD